MPSAAKGAGGCCLVERKVRMVWPRRAIGVIFAMAVAIGAGVVFLPVAALADPVTRAAGFALIQFAVWVLTDADIADGLNGDGLAALIHLVWKAVMMVCAVPVVAVASLGEVAESARAFLVCRRLRRLRRLRAMGRSRGVASAKSGGLQFRGNAVCPCFLRCRPDFRFGLLASRGPGCGSLALGMMDWTSTVLILLLNPLRLIVPDWPWRVSDNGIGSGTVHA
jgi:hypothetical protein